MYVLIKLLSKSLVIHNFFGLAQCTGLAKAKMNKILVSYPESKIQKNDKLYESSIECSCQVNVSLSVS